jgi:hypothetical protein
MTDERTIKIEMTITHTDHKGQTREVRQSRVFPISGDNPIFIRQDVAEAYREFNNIVTTHMNDSNYEQVWR